MLLCKHLMNNCLTKQLCISWPKSHRRFSTNLGALHGIKVLDMSRILAGPYCTMLLGDAGAEVFKIEHPEGDDTRTWGPPFTQKGAESAYFISCNRNKKSIAVDIKTKEGLEIIYDFAKRCDVVVENFPPGKTEKLGFHYEKLKEINPKIIYASITGYGPDGPQANRLAYDLMVTGYGGLLSITGPENGEPVRPGVALTDVSTGMLTYGSIASALYVREKTGIGQKIDASLLETQVASLANVASNYLIANQPEKRIGTAHASIVPYQGFPSKDGFLIVGALNDNQFKRLCEVMDLHSLASDERFKINPQRVRNRQELLTILRSKFSTRTTSEWVKDLDAARIPCAPINGMKEVFSDPQVLHRGMVQEVEHKTAGKIKVTGLPVKFSETKSSIRLPPPVLGEHTFEVLKNFLGYSTERIEQLRRDKVCKFAVE